MERLHAPNEFVRIRRLGEGIRAWEELWSAHKRKELTDHDT
jgi:acetylornithine deacetylase/succinyl-diaminopimelate desuccinylase-like protein